MEEEVQGKLYDWRLGRRLMRYMKPYWRVAVFSLFLVLLNSIFQVIVPLLTKTAVDRYLVPVRAQKTILPEWLFSNDPMRGLAQLGGIYLVVIIAGLAV